MIFRIRYQVAGGHTHCRLFAGRHEGALGKCGDFAMRNEEFDVFRGTTAFIDYVNETPKREMGGGSDGDGYDYR